MIQQATADIIEAQEEARACLNLARAARRHGRYPESERLVARADESQRRIVSLTRQISDISRALDQLQRSRHVHRRRT